MLAIVFAPEKCHQYTFGRPVTVYSDHKLLESITKKPLDRASKRLQGMLMRALAYDIEESYRNGKEMYLAGTLSRAHLSRPSDCWQEEFETINALSFLVMPEEKIHEIRRYTGKDNSLQQLKRITQEGWPSDQSSLPPSSLLISASGTNLQLLMVRYSVESEVWSLKECEQLSRRISIADIKELKPACATRGNMFFGQAWTRNKKHGFAPVRHAERIN